MASENIDWKKTQIICKVLLKYINMPLQMMPEVTMKDIAAEINAEINEEMEP